MYMQPPGPECSACGAPRAFCSAPSIAQQPSASHPPLHARPGAQSCVQPLRERFVLELRPPRDCLDLTARRHKAAKATRRT